ncbi:MAG: exonuclease domain-containing protein [Flavobacteriales bacterium]|nr:exonuclease domain-containing protein [Flavobacteriales bacterium]MDG1780657.1 exonuclease domain-containing protein [Flavobacteriales bacterium]
MNYIVFDLEATCWKLRKPPPQEIIEIGAVKVNDKGERLGEFSAFVKPKLNPELSKFCKQLTSIEQEDIDRARDFDDVIFDFEEWLNWKEEEILLVAWGDYDQIQLGRDADLHELSFPWLKHFMCLKLAHARMFKLKEPVGVKTALELAGYQFEGVSHRAIEDARNTARILEHHFGEWAFQDPANIQVK